MPGGERMFFFPGARGRGLLGVLHLPAPAPPAAPAPVGVVYCHPFGEEKMASHSISVRAARRLCEQGFAVLRFDFSGCGDSHGELDETGLSDWLEDLRCAMAVLAEESGARSIGLWGLRLGAWVALRYAASAAAASEPVIATGAPAASIPFLILWQPVPDAEQFLKQFLRQKLSTEIAAGREGGASLKGLVQSLEAGESVEVIGYPISSAFYLSFAASGSPGAPGRPPQTPPPQASLPTRAIPALVATASLSDEIPPGPRKVAEALAQLGHAVRSAHVHEETYWDRHWRHDAPALLEVTAAFAAEARTGAVG